MVDEEFKKDIFNRIRNTYPMKLNITINQDTPTYRAANSARHTFHLSTSCKMFGYTRNIRELKLLSALFGHYNPCTYCCGEYVDSIRQVKENGIAAFNLHKHTQTGDSSGTEAVES